MSLKKIKRVAKRVANTPKRAVSNAKALVSTAKSKNKIKEQNKAFKSYKSQTRMTTNQINYFKKVAKNADKSYGPGQRAHANKFLKNMKEGTTPAAARRKAATARLKKASK